MTYLIGAIIVLTATLIMGKHVRTSEMMATVSISAIVSMVLFMLSVWSFLFNSGMNIQEDNIIMEKQIVLDKKDLSDLEDLIIAYEVANSEDTTPENIQSTIDKFRNFIWDF